MSVTDRSRTGHVHNMCVADTVLLWQSTTGMQSRRHEMAVVRVRERQRRRQQQQQRQAHVVVAAAISWMLTMTWRVAHERSPGS